MMLNKNKDKPKDTSKEDKKKEKERLKTEKLQTKEKEKEDKKRAGTSAPPTIRKDEPPQMARTLSGGSLSSTPPVNTTPLGTTPPVPNNPASPRDSPSQSPLSSSSSEVPFRLEKEESIEVVTLQSAPNDRPSSPIPIPAQPATPPAQVAQSPPPIQTQLVQPIPNRNPSPNNHVGFTPSFPHPPSVSEFTKSGSKGMQQDQAGLLKNKISSLPNDTKQLVEYLLNIFSRALPQGWTAPPNFEAPSLEGQLDTTIDKLVEASEILFNKDTGSLLKRYGKELKESPHRRNDKWKIIANLISDENSDLLRSYLTSDILEAVIVSALLKPIEQDEAESLADVLKLSLIRDISQKELISVVQTASHSNAHISQPFEENKSLTDAIVDLVCSFRKLLSSPEEEIWVQDLTAKKDSEISAIGDSINQSIALLSHANTIKHAKTGHDIVRPLQRYFQKQIEQEVKEGERWQGANTEAKNEKAAKLQEIDNIIKDEETKLQSVQTDIADLETKLDQKRGEEKRLQETLAQKLAEREQYQKQREEAEREIKSRIDESAQHLEHHVKAEESTTKFEQDVGSILDKEVSETLRKTKEVLLELDKEVAFLEEKMITYDRSISLFSAADEPEVLDGLKKLFARSTAIYSESKQSVLRVTGVVELLHTVLGKGSAQVAELETNLEKIVSRQNALNNKYKLQKD